MLMRIKSKLLAITSLTLIGGLYLNFSSTGGQRLFQVNQPNLARHASLNIEATESSTPDGRIIISMNKKENKFFLEPVRQFDNNELWQGIQNLDTIFHPEKKSYSLALPVPEFEGKLNTLEKNGTPKMTTELIDILLPKKIRPKDANNNTVQLEYFRQIRGSGHFIFVGHDPRFGENAFPVSHPDKCVANNNTDPENENLNILNDNPDGEYLCYKLIAYRRYKYIFKYVVGGATETSRLFQSYLSIALRHKNRHGKNYLNPYIAKARFSHSFKPSMAASDLGLRPMGGMEVSSASDARMLMWNEAVGTEGNPSRAYDFHYHRSYFDAPSEFKDDSRMHDYLNSGGTLVHFSFNETPWRNKTWRRPVFFTNMWRHYGNLMICPQGPYPCARDKKIPLKQQFRFAGAKPKDAFGNKLFPHELCFYPWFTPGGNNLICRFNQHLYIVGADTGFRLKTLPGPVNGFQNLARNIKGKTVKFPLLNAKSYNICKDDQKYSGSCQPLYSQVDRDENGVEKPDGMGLKVTIPFGFNGGFWNSFPGAPPANLYQNRRPYTFSYFIAQRTDLKDWRVPRYTNINTEFDLGIIGNNANDKSEYMYGEVALDDFNDKDYLFFYHFEPDLVILPAGIDPGEVSNRYIQVGNQCQIFKQSNFDAVKTQVGLTEEAKFIAKLRKKVGSQVVVHDEAGRDAKRCTKDNSPGITVVPANSLSDSSSNMLTAKYSGQAKMEDYYHREKYVSGNVIKDPLALYSVEGFIGKGMYLEGNNSVINVPAKLNQLSPSLDQFSFELALRAKGHNISNYYGQLAEWYGVFKLFIYRSQLILSLKNSEGHSIDIRSPSLNLRSDNLKNYSHIGFSVVNLHGMTKVTIYLDGIPVKEANVFLNSQQANFKPVANNNTAFSIGPNGNGHDLTVMIDEVALSKKYRDQNYFSIAALSNFNVDLQTNQSFPFKLPQGFKFRDLRVPSQMRPMLENFSSDKIREATNIGQSLFNDRVLASKPNGGTRNITCQSCHSPSAAFADPRGISFGWNGKPISINSPTLVNRAYSRNQHLDMRTSDLYEQVLHPIMNSDEMNGHMPSILSDIESDPKYGSRIKYLFNIPANKGIGRDHLRQLLTLYVLSISSYEPDSVKARAFEGRNVFMNKGRCIACHSGPNFTDENLHNTGTGRFVKTPSLLNISQTAPYFHNSSMQSIREVVEFYNRGGQVDFINTNLDPEMKPLGLTNKEMDDLVFYLENLNGPISHGVQSIK